MSVDFGQLFQASPVALLAVLPDDPTFTMVGASDALEQISRLKRADFLGRGIFEVFPDNPSDPGASGVGNLRESFRRVLKTCSADHLELQRYDLEEEPGKFVTHYWNVKNTPILDAEGNVAYILHATEGVTKARLAELGLATSEKRFRQLAETSPFGVVIADLDGGLSYLNQKMLDLLGYTQEEAAAGQLRWDRITPPEYAGIDREAVRQLKATGSCAPFEKVYVAKDGRRVPILVAASMLETLNGQAEVAAFIVDLTERKNSEQDAFLLRWNDATRALNDPKELVGTGARLLGEFLHVDRCLYADVDASCETLEIVGDYTREVASAVGRYRFRDFDVEPQSLCQAEDGTVHSAWVVEDLKKEAVSEKVRSALDKFQVAATIAVPLYKMGRLAAIIAVQQKAPRRWRPEEMDLVRTLANRCWESIERARVTRALQESERREQLSQKAGGMGSFEWKLQENEITWSPSLEALYGVPEGTFEGNLGSWTKRVVPEDAEKAIATINTCFTQRERDCAYEFRAVLPDGTKRWLRGQAQILYDDIGAPERLIGINIDINEQKQAEAHLIQQWRTFDTVLSNIPDLNYVFNLKGQFMYANWALLQLLQLPKDEVVGKDFFELNYPHDLAVRLHQQIKQVTQTKQMVRDVTPFAGATGETRHYEYILSPVIGPDGAVTSIAGSTRDITERKQVEEQEREREEQVRESARLESLGVMAGGVAHDFNNLLTGILGNACLLAESTQESEREIAGEIVLAAQRASDLTRQMLAFSGKGRFVIEVLDLNALIQENLTLLRASLSRTVTVELSLSSDGCMVEADRSQMQQIVMNLLLNASEAIGERPGKVSVRTAATTRVVAQFSPFLQTAVPPGRYCLIEVKDDGSGMTPETLRKIFDPFFTTKFTGRGLGLAAVLGIVKGHQGDIDVITQAGRGTTFRILLPCTEIARESIRQPQTSVGTGAANRTVLVADDEEVVRKIATVALKRRGYRVLTASNGMETLEMLRQNDDVCLVILDLTMPVMTGEQAIPLIKVLRPELPIVLSSGFNEAEISRRAAFAGVSGFLQKPYTVTTIAAKVEEALLGRGE